MSEVTITITMSSAEGATMVGTPEGATLSSSDLPTLQSAPVVSGADDAPPDSAVSDAIITEFAADDSDGAPPIGLNELGLNDDSEAATAIGDAAAPEDIEVSSDAEEDQSGPVDVGEP